MAPKLKEGIKESLLIQEENQSRRKIIIFGISVGSTDQLLRWEEKQFLSLQKLET